MPYKLPLLRRLASTPGLSLSGRFGQSHSPASKLRSVPEVPDFDYKVMRTFHVSLPYGGREMQLFWCPALGRELRAISPSAVIAGNSNFPNNYAVMKYCRQHSRPYVWHGIGSVYSNAPLLRRAAQRPLSAFFRNAAHGVAFNTASKEYYIDNYGLQDDDITVVHNVVDTDAVRADRHRFAGSINSLREELTIAGRKVVLFVGAVAPAKRLDRLLGAFQKVRRIVPESVLVVVGGGVFLESVKHAARELGIADDVRFVGPRSIDANRYFMLGDVFVLPGLGGLAISHAMAHGIPVISASADGTERDLIVEGETGYLIKESQDESAIEEIVEYLTRILTNQELCDRMGAAAMARVNGDFSIDAAANKMRKVIESVV